MRAKLSPPDAEHLLVRERLHRGLDRALGSVAWLVAPAGSGKTSLLATWTHSLDQPALQRRPSIWYRVDASDRDPVAFLQVMATALPARSRGRLPAFVAEHLADLHAYALRFFRAWYSESAPGTVLVLDNLHDAIDGDQGLATLLPALVLEKPPEITLVLSSRNEPQGSLRALAADSRHVHLAYRDLRCSSSEASALAERLGLAPAEVARVDRADGWMAGVSLLLRAAPAAATTADQLEVHLFDRFATGAFDALTPQQKDLLLANAFSPWIDVEATRRHTGIHGTAQELEALWRAQFFVERRIGKAQCIEYVCHPLLRAYLRDRVRHWRSPSELRDLWARQALALQAQGAFDAALDLFLLAGDARSAGRILIEQAPIQLQQGQLASWLQRLSRLDEPDSSQVAPLAYWEGLYRQMTAPADSLACLRRAHRAWLDAGDDLNALLAVSAMLNTYFVQWSDWDQAIRWGDEAHRLQQRLGGRYPDLDTEVRVMSSGHTLMFMRPGHPLIRPWLDRARDIIRDEPASHHLFALGPFVIGYSWWVGDMNLMREASRLALRALRTAPPPSGPALVLMVWIGIAGLNDALACDAERRDVLDETLAVADTAGIRLMDYHLWVHKLMKALVLDDRQAGQHAFDRLTALDPRTPATAGLSVLSRLALHFLNRDWKQAITVAETALQDSAPFECWAFGEYIARIIVAEALTLTGHHERAAVHVRAILDFADQWGSACLQLHANLIQAASAFANDDPAGTTTHLRNAFGTARRNGYLALSFGASPVFFAPLAAHALGAGIEVTWVRQFIRNQRLPAPRAGIARWPYPVRITALGPFRLSIDDESIVRPGRAQQRVLELIKAVAARGGSNVPAEALALSLWPDAPLVSAMASLNITLHRARKLLGGSDRLRLHDGKLSFNGAEVDLDLWRRYRLHDRIDAVTTAMADEPRAPEILEDLAEALVRDGLGSLLEGERDLPWVIRARNDWRERSDQRVQAVARACIASGRTQAAVHLLARSLEWDPTSTAVRALLATATGPSLLPDVDEATQETMRGKPAVR